MSVQIPEHQTGSDIYISIKRHNATGTYINIDTEVADLFVCASNENGSVKIKFSKNVKTGYQNLIRVSATEYLAVLTSDNSVALGQGYYVVSWDFIFVDPGYGDGRDNKKGQYLTGYLQTNPLQDER